MASALERLKALNQKLDAKLSEENINIDNTDSSSKRAKKTTKRSKKSSEEKEQISHKELAQKLISHMQIDGALEPTRATNLERVTQLYVELGIYDKAPMVEKLFIYKAMNISGISLKEEDFGEIREGKYVQVIAITYEPDKNGKKKAKNISLGYFGKAETLADEYKNEIVEFVLRWRYEKAFQNLEHYKDLIANINPNLAGTSGHL